MILISLFVCTCAQTPTLFWAGHHNSSSINSHLGKREPNYSYCFLFSLFIKERKPEIVLYPQKNKSLIKGESEKEGL